MTKFTRFSFDMGTNSLGWAVFTGHYPQGVPSARASGKAGMTGEVADIKAAGVRIYSDGRNPKDGKSLAEMRRGPRTARRRRDRFLQRQRGLNQLLKRFGLFPIDVRDGKALAKLNPLLLRFEALGHKLRRPSQSVGHLRKYSSFKADFRFRTLSFATPCNCRIG